MSRSSVIAEYPGRTMLTRKASFSGFRLLQLTDMHLGANADFEQSGINTYASFKAVLEEVAGAKNRVDMIVASGDISGDGLASSYRLFAELLDSTKIPYCWLPGNHDDITAMVANGLGTFQDKVALAGWNLLLLNSAVFDRVNGELPASELEQLEKNLQEDPLTPTLIFVHHPPLNVGCEWLDEQKINNGHELFNLLGEFRNVKGIFCGHVHQAQYFSHFIPVYTTPSTCFQFKANCDDFAIANLPPGYRWIELDQAGGFSTGVNYLHNFPQTANLRCIGY